MTKKLNRAKITSSSKKLKKHKSARRTDCDYFRKSRNISLSCYFCKKASIKK